MKLPRMPDGKELLVVDVECFRNYFLAVVTDGETYRYYERPEFGKLANGLSNQSLVLGGFNSFTYDDVMLRAIIDNPHITHEALKYLNDRIIEARTVEAEDDNFRDTYMTKAPWAYSLDIFQILNKKGSLKEWSCRDHSPEVEETPHDFSLPLPEDKIPDVRKYCRIDCANTVRLIVKHWEKVTLRAKLDEHFSIGPKIYRLPEQGIAQATFLKLHQQETGEYRSDVETRMKSNPDNHRPVWPLTEILSDKLAYDTPPFQAVHAAMINGSAKRTDARGQEWALDCPALPPDGVVRLADKEFHLGVGGLHSLDGPGRFVTTDTHGIVDLDVTSYYPSIIIEDRLFPQQLGPSYVEHMREIRDMRVAAKKAGDKITAEALKIVVNSTFGKLNDFYSPLRSVPDALRVTINGQMYLLMLVEMLHQVGFDILSGNTDGVTCVVPRTEVGERRLATCIDAWQTATGFVLERANYISYTRQHVNSYVAVTDSGKVKVKGAFEIETQKGDNKAIKRAAIAWLTKRVPLHETIAAADVRDMISYSRCKSGGTFYHGDVHVGKLARWVASIDGPPLERVDKHGKRSVVGPSAHRCMLVRNLDTIDLSRVDYAFYRAAADDLVCSTLPLASKAGLTLKQRRLL